MNPFDDTELRATIRRRQRGYPRVVIGKKKGTKCRLRYPSMNGGYISHTFNSMAEARRFKNKLDRWAKVRTKITKI